MPSFGLGLSLGSSNPLKGFDSDASAYIISNKIPNSASIYNIDATRSVEMDGSSKYLEAPTNTSLNITTDFSCSFWVKIPFTALGSGTTTPISNFILFGKGQWNTNGWYVQMQDRVLRFVTNGPSVNFGSGIAFWDGNTSLYSSSSLADEWQHILITYNYTSKTVKYYLNGVFINSSVYTTNPVSPGSTSFFIGRDANLGAPYGKFLLDELGIWNRELTSDEAVSLYNSFNGLRFTDIYNKSLGVGLIHYWSFDEVSGSRTDSLNGLVLNDVNSCVSNTGKVGILENVNPQIQINTFISWLKSQNYWSRIMVVPMRSIHQQFTNTSLSFFNYFGGFKNVSLPLFSTGGSFPYHGGFTIRQSSSFPKAFSYINNFTNATTEGTIFFAGTMPVDSLPLGGQSGNIIAMTFNVDNSQAYWFNPNSGYGAEYSYCGSGASLSNNTRHGYHLFGMSFGQGYGTRAFRDTSLINSTSALPNAFPSGNSLLKNGNGLIDNRMNLFRDGGFLGQAVAFIYMDLRLTSSNSFFNNFKSTLGYGLNLGAF